MDNIKKLKIEICSNDKILVVILIIYLVMLILYNGVPAK